MLKRMIDHLNNRNGIITLGYDKNGWPEKSFFMDKNYNIRVNEILLNSDGSYASEDKYQRSQQYPVTEIQALELMKEKLQNLELEAKENEKKEIPADTYVVTDDRYFININSEISNFDFLTNYKSTASKLSLEDAEGWVEYMQSWVDNGEYDKFDILEYNLIKG